MLIHFDDSLQNTYTTESRKAELLDSLVELLKLMGRERVTPVRMRVITTLKICSEEPGLKEACLRAWDEFVHCLNFQAVGPLLPTIVCHLLKFSEERKAKVAHILRYLIVEHEKEVENSLKYLFFLPTGKPELKDIERVIAAQRIRVKTEEDVLDELEMLSNAVTNESATVGFFVL